VWEETFEITSGETVTFGDFSDVDGSDLVVKDYSSVAPIALLHGVNSGCNNVRSWVDMISESLDN